MILSLPPDQRAGAPAGTARMPSRAWYLAALVVFLLSTTGIITEVYRIVESFPHGMQFLVPGSVTFHANEPGTYVLWDEVSTFFEDKSYQSSEKLPGGIVIKVREASSGREVLFAPSSGGTETVGNVKRVSIGDISLGHAGSYVIEVSGDFPQRVFYVRQSGVKEVLTGLAGIALLGLLGWVLAPVLAVVVLVRRSARKGPAKQADSAPAAEKPRAAEPAKVKEERMYAMFCHLGALSGFIVPFGNIIVPLVLWLVKKDTSPFIDQHGKESLNFQLSLLIYSVISAVLIVVVVGIFLLAALWIFNLVIVIIAGVRAESGEQFRYPITIRFVK